MKMLITLAIAGLLISSCNYKYSLECSLGRNKQADITVDNAAKTIDVVEKTVPPVDPTPIPVADPAIMPKTDLEAIPAAPVPTPVPAI